MVTKEETAICTGKSGFWAVGYKAIFILSATETFFSQKNEWLVK